MNALKKARVSTSKEDLRCTQSIKNTNAVAWHGPLDDLRREQTAFYTKEDFTLSESLPFNLHLDLHPTRRVL